MEKNKDNVCCSACGKINTLESEIKFIRVDDVKEIVLCQECIDYMHSVLELDKKSVVKNDSNISLKKINSPKDIYNHLNKFIISQEDAKKQLSISIFQHYRRLIDPSIEKSNILIIGPTGTGKTELARSIAKYLDIPFVTADATSLTTRGYVGEDTDSVISRLLQVCNYNVEKAEKGIVFIDEIDKIAKIQNQDSQISTVSVQQELLKIMEGTQLKVSKGPKGRSEEIFVNTKNILFICAGSFAGIEEIISPPKEKTIGINIIELVYEKNKCSKIESDHLLKYGLIPEFLGRLPVIVQTYPLTKEDMFKILTEPENSLTSQYKKMLKLDNVDAEFEISFLEKLSSEAIDKKIGARGIRKVLESHLKELFFNIDNFKNSKILISEKIEVFELNNDKNNLLQK